MSPRTQCNDPMNPDQTSNTSAPTPVTRREGVRAAAIAALAAGLGVPRAAEASTAAGRITMKIHKGTSDGGALVATVDVGDVASAFLGSTAGMRGVFKWYDGTQELATMAAPRFCCIKLSP